MKMKVIAAGVLLGLGAVVALPASAVSITASNTTATISTTHQVDVTIDREGTPVEGFFIQLDYDPTLVSLPPATVIGDLPAHVTVTGTGAADLACNDTGVAPVSRFLCAATTPITSATFTLHIQFNIGATAAPAPGTPLTFGPGSNYTTGGGTLEPPFDTVNPGSITIVTGPPPDVVVTLNPPSGTVNFGPPGAPGATATGSIAVSNTGTIGTGTVSGCTITGADAASFTIASGHPATVPPATSIGLEATLGAAALTATLTCDVTDSTGTSSATWTLSAPAGTVLTPPTFNAPSGPVTLGPPQYTIGNPASANIAIGTTGGDAGATAATLTGCTASAGFTVAPTVGAFPLTFPTGGPNQSITVGCNVGAADATGTVTCNGTDATGTVALTWNVTCPAVATAPPPPTFVPATSLWSKLALFGVFAALGMLILGLRRNH